MEKALVLFAPGSSVVGTSIDVKLQETEFCEYAVNHAQSREAQQIG